MRAFTFIAILLSLCYVQAQECIQGLENDAAIFHVLDVCDNSDDDQSEAMFFIFQNSTSTFIALSTFYPSSNCSSSTLNSTQYFPMNECVNGGEEGNILVFSLPSPDFVLPYVNAYMTMGYEDCPGKDFPLIYQRVLNPASCFQYNDGTSSNTFCDSKKYYINYFDTHDCTGKPYKAARGNECNLGEQDACYLGAPSDPTQKFMLVMSYYPADSITQKKL